MAKKFFLLLIFLPLSLNLWAQENNNQLSFDLKDKIPVDKAVTIGKLSNGLTYYIHPNKNPEKFAQIKLIVKAGSIQEDDDQLGLAHFLAHISLAGTKNFSRQQLVNFFNSTGIKFGPEVTAAASFEGTIYSLPIPTDSPNVVQKSLDILKDWAVNISFDKEAIDKERSVVIEEMNSGLDINTQIFQKQVPYLFKNSRYADRITFGKKKILESFTPETLKRFYSDWYRPDLMAIIVVGDVDKNQVEKLIKDKFADLENPINSRPFLEYLIPEHKDTLISILAEKDIPVATLLIHHEFHSKPDVSLQDMRDKIPATLFALMFNQRMTELKLKQDFPMTNGSVSQGIFVANNSIFTLEALGVKENRYIEAIDYILTAYEKAKRFGFSEKELLRAKSSLIRSLQFEAIEKNSYESSLLAAKYTRNFFLQEPIPGADYEFEFNHKFLQTVTRNEVNNLISSLLKDNNLVVTLSMPAKSELKVPTEKEILTIMRGIKAKEIIEYDEELAKRPLLEKEPTAGSIKLERQIKEIGATEWTLSNGAKVVFKPTDFKLDEILMFASSPGGTSLVNQPDYNVVRSAASIIENSGVGTFSRIDLKKYLVNKHVFVTPYIDDSFEGLRGNCSPFDLETMMKLTHLYFTSPRKDEAAFKDFKSKQEIALANQNSLLQNVFQDSVNALLYNHNPRKAAINKNILQQMDLDKSISFYRERFANAGDFTFFFVGTITINEFKSYIEKYIASLPFRSKKENWKDNNISYTQGIEKNVVGTSNSKSIVQLIYTSKFKYSLQNCLELNALQKLLSNKLQQVLANAGEANSGLAIEISPEHFPKEKVRASIKLSCATEKIDVLTKILNTQLDSIKQFGMRKKDTELAQTSLLKEMESNIKQNNYWLQLISSAYINGYDPKMIIQMDSLVKKLSPDTMQKWIKEIFRKNNYIRVTLLSETKK
jgi:zinc protease